MNKTNVPEKALEVLKEINLPMDKAMWNCHGTWVMYHKACEQIAAHKKITFDLPKILEQDVSKRIVVMLVTGKCGEISEWSIGEATPDNNKNNYPFAMAEKRAKDRVILKIIGLHGDVYTDSEIDEQVQKELEQKAKNNQTKTNGATPPQEPVTKTNDFGSWKEWAGAKESEIDKIKSQAGTLAWANENQEQLLKLQGIDKPLWQSIFNYWENHREKIEKGEVNG
tara:strand:+ start:147 stop:821 length:675 start_codon:yes stop_codon:yes gene_type:complete